MVCKLSENSHIYDGDIAAMRNSATGVLLISSNSHKGTKKLCALILWIHDFWGFKSGGPQKSDPLF